MYGERKMGSNDDRGRSDSMHTHTQSNTSFMLRVVFNSWPLLPLGSLSSFKT